MLHYRLRLLTINKNTNTINIINTKNKMFQPPDTPTTVVAVFSVDVIDAFVVDVVKVSVIVVVSAFEVTIFVSIVVIVTVVPSFCVDVLISVTDIEVCVV